MKVFPTCLFAPDGQEADIERRTISGGTALSGDEDIVATDGGGRVFYEIADPFLDDVPAAMAWRAISAYMDGGARAIIVPFCDGRHQPGGFLDSVPHSDGSPFSDESEYETLAAQAAITGAAILRATVIEIEFAGLSREILGGEWLSIDHPVMRWRAYRIAEVIEQTATTATLSIRPPLREAVGSGEAVDFNDPRCVMRLDGEMRSPSSMGFASSQGVRFVEDFSGSYT